jgi:hypothetical protein
MKTRSAEDMSPANVSALTCGRNDNDGDDAVDTPKRAAGAERTRREGFRVATAPVRFSGLLASGRIVHASIGDDEMGRTSRWLEQSPLLSLVVWRRRCIRKDLECKFLG